MSGEPYSQKSGRIGIPLPIFFKLGRRVDIVKECSGIADRKIVTNKYRVTALD